MILEVWDETGQETAGAAELELIQKALLEKLGAQGRESPAAIARILADNGVRLKHPEVLEADARWREREMFAGFSHEELNFTTIEAAVAWVEKLTVLPAEVELRRFVLQIKTELELMAGSKKISLREREVASEVAHWLTVWLQNPPIFADWLSLRRQSAEYRERFDR
ncbi:MAG TPA: hypothetical protein VM941_12185 [Pyrinomonadaceae bacterium]|nr:hypothetical protein [Pyrinomonadaceae bacterium]